MGLNKLISINKGSNREKMLNRRVKDFGLPKVLEAIRSINKSDFLMGRATDFVITFDWFIRPNNFSKVIEGNYIKRNFSSSNKSTGIKETSFNNFSGRKSSERYEYLQEQYLLGQATDEEKAEYEELRRNGAGI